MSDASGKRHKSDLGFRFGQRGKRSRSPSETPSEEGEFITASIVSAQTGAPLVQIAFDTARMQVDAKTAKVIGLQLIETAEAAIMDSQFLAFMRADGPRHGIAAEETDRLAVTMLREFRRHREATEGASATDAPAHDAESAGSDGGCHAP